MRYAESAEQRLFVQRFRLDPRTRDLPACAIPNAGRRSRATGGIMKAEGMSRGAPDWILFEPGRPVAAPARFVGLALEFKAPVGRTKITEHQAWWHDALRARLWRVEVVTSATVAWSVLCDYLDIKE